MATNDMRNFVRKLQRRIGAAPQPLEKRMIVGEYEEEVLLQSVPAEVIEQAAKRSDEAAQQNAYIVYMGCPTIRGLAGQLVEMGSLDEPMKVMDLFKPKDVEKMARTVVELFNEFNAPTVREVDAVKKK